MLAQRIEARIAEFQAQLIFVLGAETPVAFVASGKSRGFAQFANMNFGMDFQLDHDQSPSTVSRATNAAIQFSLRLNLEDLKQGFMSAVGKIVQSCPRTSRNDPWLIERTFIDNGLTCEAV